eukprot:GHVL01039412.1.p1 GENE.GHVL01039412.1~~GHVL01039412.1.p1  ORF type:complete len:416 (+),score=94.07 GHVL01039412.1:135-1382(+)
MDVNSQDQVAVNDKSMILPSPTGNMSLPSALLEELLSRNQQNQCLTPKHMSEERKMRWSSQEDQILRDLVKVHGVSRWALISKLLNDRVHGGKEGRTGRQCRERWCNHLDPNNRKGDWCPDEDELVIQKQQELGNRWAEIAKILNGRTEHQVKNRYNSLIRNRHATLAPAHNYGWGHPSQYPPPPPPPSAVAVGGGGANGSVGGPSGMVLPSNGMVPGDMSWVGDPMRLQNLQNSQFANPFYNGMNMQATGYQNMSCVMSGNINPGNTYNNQMISPDEVLHPQRTKRQRTSEEESSAVEHSVGAAAEQSSVSHATSIENNISKLLSSAAAAVTTSDTCEEINRDDGGTTTEEQMLPLAAPSVGTLSAENNAAIAALTNAQGGGIDEHFHLAVQDIEKLIRLGIIIGKSTSYSTPQ